MLNHAVPKNLQMLISFVKTFNSFEILFDLLRWFVISEAFLAFVQVGIMKDRFNANPRK